MDIPVEEVSIGDLVVVRPGDKFPVDGIVKKAILRWSEINSHRRVHARQENLGDEVIEATINKNGKLQLEATKVGEVPCWPRSSR